MNWPLCIISLPSGLLLVFLVMLLWFDFCDWRLSPENRRKPSEVEDDWDFVASNSFGLLVFFSACLMICSIFSGEHIFMGTVISLAILPLCPLAMFSVALFPKCWLLFLVGLNLFVFVISYAGYLSARKQRIKAVA